jgi:hypothetical protein
MPSGHLWEGWNCKIASAADRHWLMSNFMVTEYPKLNFCFCRDDMQFRSN